MFERGRAFYFTDVLWPALRKVDFLRAIRAYQARNRRRQPKPECQSCDTLGIGTEHRRRRHEQGIHAFAARGDNGVV